jgi:hypothetical protein
MQRIHPSYGDFRTIEYTQDRPQQTFYDATAKKKTTLPLPEYYSKYCLYLRMDALCNDSSTTLFSKNEQDLFFRRCDRGAELLPILNRDRDFPDKAHKFIPNNLLHTVSTELTLLPPLQRSSPSYGTGSNRSGFGGSYRSHQKSINQLHLTDNDDVDNGNDDDDEDSLAIANVHRVVTAEVFQSFAERIRQEPRLVNTDCMVCRHFHVKNRTHRFCDCPILQNHDLVKGIFLDLVSFCSRAQKKVDAATSATDTAMINSVLAAIDERTQDFRDGNSQDNKE